MKDASPELFLKDRNDVCCKEGSCGGDWRASRVALFCLMGSNSSFREVDDFITDQMTASTPTVV